jgi:uncharacterized protein
MRMSAALSKPSNRYFAEEEMFTVVLSTMTSDVLTVLSGCLVGLILGLIGGGGSIIAVPLLLYVVGMPSVHTAIGTSAVAVSLSALASLMAAAKEKLVKWPCALVFTAAGVLGSVAGSHLALQIPGAKILALFGGLMMIIGTLMLLRKNAEGNPNVRLNLSTARGMAPWLIGVGFAVGGLAGFFGIGGGFLIVPGLMFATGMTISSAIATSLVAITVFGATTASTYAILGEVVWRSVALFVGGGLVGSFGGQYLGRRLNNHKPVLQSLFAVFVIGVGIFTLYNGLP